MNGDVSFGAMLRRLSRAAFLTQEQVAERSSLSARAIRNLEGDRTRPRQHTVLQACEALGPQNEHRVLFLAVAGRRASALAGAAPAASPGHAVPRPDR